MLQTLAATSICHSLPLMGIGNAAAAAASERRASFSLPLMGIGNLVDSQAEPIDPNLITPHGDWELAEDGRDEVAGILITPHGDWEPCCSLPLLPCSIDDSLPLMGIGNR